LGEVGLGGVVNASLEDKLARGLISLTLVNESIDCLPSSFGAGRRRFLWLPSPDWHDVVHGQSVDTVE
jgi:hypothetical protein